MQSKFRGSTRMLSGGTAAAVFVLAVTLSGQAPATPAPAAAPAAQPTGKPYVATKTPWGDPDIQGMYNFSYVMSVNLERCGGGGTGTAPAELVAKGRAALDAIRAREEAAAKARGADPAAGGGAGGRGG